MLTSKQVETKSESSSILSDSINKSDFILSLLIIRLIRCTSAYYYTHCKDQSEAILHEIVQ